jgi:hypothetical protein
VLTNAGGDASDLLVTAAASPSDLVAAGGLQVSGTGDTRMLTITPTTGVDGRAWITVTASDTLGRSATMGFPLIVGVQGDRDLDGVPDSEEDAAPNGGDMNGDGIPDSWQVHVAWLRRPSLCQFIRTAKTLPGPGYSGREPFALRPGG